MRTALCFSVALSLGLASSADAQSLPDIFDIPDIFEVEARENATYIELGGAILTRPAYLGSENNDTNILPYINAEYKGRLFINPYLGAGVHAINTEKFRVSAAAFIAPGRNPEDTPFLDKAFDIDTGVLARGAARYNFGLGAVDVIASIPVSGDVEGAQIQARIGTLYPVSDRFRIAPTAQITYNTANWNNTFYGLDRTQAIAAQSAILNYSDGLSEGGLTLAGFLELPNDFTAVGLVNYAVVLGDIKDSPLTPQNDGLSATVGLAKRF